MRFVLLLLLFVTTAFCAEDINALVRQALPTGDPAPIFSPAISKQDSDGQTWTVSHFTVDGKHWYSTFQGVNPIQTVKMRVELSEALAGIPEDTAYQFALDFGKEFIAGFPDIVSANALVAARRTVNPSMFGPGYVADALEDLGISPYYPPITADAVSRSGTDYGPTVVPHVFYVLLEQADGKLVLKFPGGQVVPLVDWREEFTLLPAAILAIAPVPEDKLDTDGQRLQATLTGLKYRLYYTPYVDAPSRRTKLMRILADDITSARDNQPAQ